MSTTEEKIQSVDHAMRTVRDKLIKCQLGLVKVAAERDQLQERLNQVSQYCEPHTKFMWAKYIQGICLNKAEWRS